jgi:hypothetical protein
MPRYKNLSGRSNVESYEIDNDSITVTFMSGTIRNYLYDSSRPGSSAVSHMKDLAAQGQGLNSYISSTVKTNFSRKW